MAAGTSEDRGGGLLVPATDSAAAAAARLSSPRCMRSVRVIPDRWRRVSLRRTSPRLNPQQLTARLAESLGERLPRAVLAYEEHMEALFSAPNTEQQLSQESQGHVSPPVVCPEPRAESERPDENPGVDDCSGHAAPVMETTVTKQQAQKHSTHGRLEDNESYRAAQLPVVAKRSRDDPNAIESADDPESSRCSAAGSKAPLLMTDTVGTDDRDAAAGTSRSQGQATGPSRCQGQATGPSRSQGQATGPTRSQGQATGPTRSQGQATGPSRSQGQATGPTRSQARATGPSRCQKQTGGCGETAPCRQQEVPVGGAAAAAAAAAVSAALQGSGDAAAVPLPPAAPVGSSRSPRAPPANTNALDTPKRPAQPTNGVFQRPSRPVSILKRSGADDRWQQGRQKRPAELWRREPPLEEGSIGDKLRRVEQWLEQCRSLTEPACRQTAELTPPTPQRQPQSASVSSSVLSSRGRPRRRRIKYTEEEVQNLLHGVRTYGRDFRAIRLVYQFHPARTTVDLYDKYRHMTARQANARRPPNSLPA